MDQPITYDWLSTSGFKLLAREDRQPTAHARRDIGAELLGGRPFLGSSDDLCIELAPATNMSDWFCWIVQVEPRRHIHVRHMKFTWEVERLWEGLTGRKWGEGAK